MPLDGIATASLGGVETNLVVLEHVIGLAAEGATAEGVVDDAVDRLAIVALVQLVDEPVPRAAADAATGGVLVLVSVIGPATSALQASCCNSQK